MILLMCSKKCDEREVDTIHCVYVQRSRPEKLVTQERTVSPLSDFEEHHDEVSFSRSTKLVSCQLHEGKRGRLTNNDARVVHEGKVGRLTHSGARVRIYTNFSQR